MAELQELKQIMHIVKAGRMFNNKRKVQKKVETSNFLTPLILEYMEKGFVIGQPFQMHPYKWNKITQRPENITSKWRLLLWYFNILITFAYSAFVVVRCIQINRNKTVPKSEKVYMQFIAVYFIYPSVMHIAVFFHGKELPRFVQGFAQFYKMFEDKYCSGLKKKPKSVKICEFLISNSYRNINCITVMVVVGMYFAPGSPEHLTSLADDPQSLTFFQKFPFLCFLGYIELINHTYCFVLVFVEYAFIFPTLIIIDELSSKNCKLTHEKFRCSEEMYRMYNSIKILVGSFNEIYSSFLTPATKVYLVTVIVISIYGSIRISGVAAWTIGFIGFVCITFTLIVFSEFAEFHDKSLTVLETWRKETMLILCGGRLAWNRRVLRSMTPMNVTVGSLYGVDRKMILTMIEGISIESVNFLLANS